jgi:RES domain
MPPRLVGFPPGGLYRVGRKGSPLTPGRSARLVQSDAPVLDGGRFDPPRGGAGMLYTAASEEAAFAETLARFRVSPEAATRLGAQLPADAGEPADLGPDLSAWASTRAIVHVQTRGGDWHLVDIGEPATHTYLTGALSETLRAHGLREYDRGVVMSPDRRLTRPAGEALMQWGQRHERVAGIEFESRLAAEFRCQALFRPEALDAAAAQVQDVDPTHPALVWAARRIGIGASAA